jgi:superoxide dismutase, Cu-Zn family
MRGFSVLLSSVLLVTACNRAPAPEENAVDANVANVGNVADEYASNATGNGAATLSAAFQNPIKDSEGKEVGSVASTGGNATGLPLTIRVHGLPPGVHGMHLHEVGLCDPPKFESSGAHWNPAGRKHGHENPEGPHAGDLGNLTVAADGTGSADALVATTGPKPRGLSFVIHAKVDDEKTDPSGNSGDRIACGIVFPGG